MSYNILIVDDSNIIRSVVKKTIDMAGIEVNQFHEATNGAEALEILDKEWIDMVFADLHMPVMNGMEMIAKMSEDNLLMSVPVIIVSSDQSQTRIDKLKQQGIRAYIKKPFRPENFRDVITDVLNSIGE